MAELSIHDNIVVESQGGECKIQLCFGDITKLQKKDKVDVIFVSAFSGNYMPLFGTVIGALEENLKLSVAKLAEDKEEDLRTLYSCWWSKPLPSNLPYRRLLCFESRRNRGGRPQELVGHAFRCLVPILKNEDASVITPLLSTGNQGCDPAIMLKGMIEAAVNWVKAGLPIRLLKIVIYEKGRQAHKESILQTFEELKTRYESANFIPQEVPLEYDVYLSYSEKDQKIAELIQLKLVEEKPDIRIFNSRQKVDTEVFWQEAMYDVMQKSARVITGHAWQQTLYHSIDGTSCMLALISPSYLKSAVCMEEYSLAQTKHLSQDKLHLIPICLQDGLESDFSQITHLPMLDARPDVFDDAIHSICVSIVSWLKTNSFKHLDKLLSKKSTQRIDVTGLMERLRMVRLQAEYRSSLNGPYFPPNLDRLMDDGGERTAKTGGGTDGDGEGQKAGATCHTGHQGATKDAETKEGCESKGDGNEKKEEEKKSEEVVKKAEEEGQKSEDPVEKTEDEVKKTDGEEAKEQNKDAEEGTEQTREGAQKEKEESVKSYVKKDAEQNAEEMKEKDEKEESKPTVKSHVTSGQNEAKEAELGVESSTIIALSYHPSDKKFGTHFEYMLKRFAPSAIVKSEFGSDQERLDYLEKADNIVALLSPNYIESPQHLEEFHIGLWRQRVSPAEAPLLIPIQVAALPHRPTYFRLVGYPVNVWDSFWAEMYGQKALRSPPEVEEIRSNISRQGLQKLSPDEVLPMTQAAQVLMASMKKQRELTKAASLVVRPALVNTAKLQSELESLTEQKTPHLEKYLLAVPPDTSKACTIM